MKFAFAALAGVTAAVRLQEEIDVSGLTGLDILEALWTEVSGVIENDQVIDAEEYELLKDDVADFFALDDAEKEVADKLAKEMLAEDGSISAEDALLLAGKVAGKDEALTLEEIGQAIFNGVDADGDATLDKDEILDTCEKYGIDVDEDLVDAALSELDVNDEDGVQMDELLDQKDVSDSSDDDSSDDDSSDDDSSDDDSSDDDSSDEDDVQMDELVLAQEDVSEEEKDLLHQLAVDLIGEDLVVSKEEAAELAPKVFEFFGLSEEQAKFAVELGEEALADDDMIDLEELAWIAGEIAGVEDFDLADALNHIKDAADLNDDGEVSLEEALQGAETLGVSFSDEEIEAALF